MKKLLSGKIAVVTGGSRGIGQAIVQGFVAEGASCLFLGTNREKGEETASKLRELCEADQKVAFYPADVSSFDQVEETFQKIVADHGAIHILVNNAGITKDTLLMRMAQEDWDHVINTNLKSIFNTCKAVIRPMMKAREGKIINITSIVGLMGNPGQTNYAASKAGMIGFTKSLAKEVASRNICVNSIAPGFIRSDMTDQLSEEIKNEYMKQIPLQRFGNPEEIANVAIFLASGLANYITGQVITVDGGMVMY